MSNEKSSWTKEIAYSRDLGVKHPPSYPNEMLVKLCCSKGYSDLTGILFQEKVKVCELGCFSGNNLRFFIENGFHAHGVEINDDMIQLGIKNLQRLGYPVPEIKQGDNLNIPYEDGYFDMLVTINTLHYCHDEDTHRALEEYKRVIRPNGVVVIETAGKNHFACKEGVRNHELNWTWKSGGFRQDQTFGFFDDEDHFRKILSEHFSHVEIHRRVEITKKIELEFYIGVCQP